MRYLISIVICASLLSACGDNPASPPTPLVVANGAWAGTWAQQQCSETGAAIGVICHTLPLSGSLRLTLTQSGSSVSGTADIGVFQAQVSGPLNGATLHISGRGRAGTPDAPLTVTDWASTITGASMTGTFRFTLIFGDNPLDSVSILASLQGVTTAG